MRNSHRWLPIAIGVCAVVALYTAIAALLAAAQRFNVPLGPATGAGAARISLTAIIFAAVVSDVLLAAMIALAIHDHLSGERISPLFWSIIAVKIVLAVLTNLYGMQSIDILAHGAPQWSALYQPEVRFFQSIMLFCLPASLAAMIGVLLRGRRWSAQRIVIVYLAIAFATAAIVFVAVTLLTTQNVVP